MKGHPDDSDAEMFLARQTVVVSKIFGMLHFDDNLPF